MFQVIVALSHKVKKMKLIKPDSVDVKIYKYSDSATVSFEKKGKVYIPSVNFNGSFSKLCKVKSKLMFAKNLHIVVDGKNNHVLCISIDGETLFLGENFESFIKDTQEAVEDNALSIKILKNEKLSKLEKWNIFYKGRTLSKKNSDYSLDWKDPKNFLLTIFLQIVPGSLFKGALLVSFSFKAIFSGLPFLLMFLMPLVFFLLACGYISTRRNIKKILKIIQENQKELKSHEEKMMIEYNTMCEINTFYY